MANSTDINHKTKFIDHLLSRTISFIDRLTTKKVAVIFLGVGLLIYVNSLFNGFVADDVPLVASNPSIQSVANIPKLFSTGTVHDENNVQRTNFYRPIFSSTLSVIYSVSGGKPFLFHLMQILLHITNATLVYLILSTLLKKNISFLLSLLFLVHPFNTETVIYISNLQDILFVLFGLAALYLSINTGKGSQQSVYVGAFLLLLSLLSKETGIVFLFIVPVFLYLFKKGKILFGLMQSAIALLIYLLLRFGVAQIYFPQAVLSPIMTLSFWERMLIVPKIKLFYLKTFVFPNDLLIFQSWTVKQPTLSDFFIPLSVVIIFFGLLIYLGKLIYLKNILQFKSFVFFFIWYMVGIGIHLQIIPLDQTVADRWFYIPMIGLLGITGVAVDYFKLSKPSRSLLVLPILFLISLMFSARVIVRNTNWKDENTLYSHDIKYNPNSYQLEKGLAIISSTQGNLEEAETHYKRAVTLFPHSDTYRSIGIFYLLHNRFPEARDSFETASRYNPEFTYTWLLLAISKYKLGDKEGALSAAQKAYSLSPNSNILTVINTIESDQEIIYQ